jgi:hypothetical protein
MLLTHIVLTTVTTVTIAANAFVAVADFARARFVLANSASLGVPHSWLPALGAAKAAGALGLLVGLFGVPYLGAAAALGLIAYYVGAVAVHLRAGERSAALAFPGAFLLLAVGSLASIPAA